MSVPVAVFGPGILVLTRTDIALPTPINVGYAQEFSLDFSGTLKPLYGQKQFPLVVARSTIKASGKFKAAVVSGLAMNTAFYGNTFAAGGIAWNVDSTFSIPASSAWTVTMGSSTTFDANLGVKYALTGLPLQRVSTGLEVTGFYSQTNNVLTFGSGDASAALKVTYTTVTAVGQNLVVTNQQIGNTPTFQLDYYTNLNQPASKPFVVRVFQAVGEKHSMAFKLEDYMMPDFDFQLYGNAADQIYTCYMPEVS